MARASVMELGALSKMQAQTRSAKRTERVPRYLAIKNYILQKIHSGEAEPESKIESENELAARFDVSRLTVQRAIRDLTAEGYLTRIQGAGTFVAPRTTQFSLLEVRDIGEQSRAMGHVSTTEVLLQRRVKATDHVAAMLEVPVGKEVFQALLLQRSDGEPLAIEERWLRCEVFPDFLDQNFEKSSIYSYLSRHSVLEDVETILQAVMPSEAYRNHLSLDSDAPCLYLERRNWNKGQVVTLTCFTFAGPDFRLGSRYKPLGGG